MAQIVTITNPLTGQPVQVDQLEHTAQQIDDAIARAKAGGEIDLTKLPGIESTDYPGCYYRMVGGVVEWVNPPLNQLGAEYRTTERYLNKPVYVMTVDGLSSSAGAWKQINGFGSNIDELVRYTATGVESTYNEIVPIPSTIADGYKTEGGVVRTVQNNIYIIYKCNTRGLSNVKFTLYYTKTTD